MKRVIVEVTDSDSDWENAVPLPNVSPPHTAPAEGPRELALMIQPHYYDLIKNGRKTVEGRLMGLNKVLQQGEILVMRCRDPARPDLRLTITRCERHASFLDLLSTVGFQQCIPDASCIEAAEAVYHSFPGYKLKEREVGVVAYHWDQAIVSGTVTARGEVARPQQAMQTGTSSEEPPRKKSRRR